MRCPHCDKQINDWDRVNNAITHSKIKRYPWHAFFKESLTKICAKAYAEGKTSDQLYEELSDKLFLFGVQDQKAFSNLRISVSSRFAEMKSEQKKIEETKQNLRESS